MANAEIKKVSVIIAAYNEAKNIAEVIRRVQAVALFGIEKEIVVVDDGSTDGTRDILRQTANVRAFFHEKNQGKGGALKTGIANALGDVFILQDADLEYSPEDYAVLLKPIQEGRTELVLGSRFSLQGPKFFTRNGDPFVSHYIGNKIIIWLTNLFYGQSVTDYEGCYKAFTRSLFDKVKVQASGFEFDNELVCKSIRLGYKIAEVPIQYRPRLYSEGKKIKWTDGIRMLWSILKWRFWPL
ncbi:MAG TPA: glycosyltransferase family 2 protein [Candidatus Omnitrophota bacterium]|nr:glycosyltransferase family 2 protein [Candidatus Omnitrophota bacterium]